MSGRHRASRATYARRQIAALILLLAVAGGAAWFFLFRGDGDTGDTSARPCDEYRADLVEAYTDLRDTQVVLIDLLAPLDEGGTLRPRQVSQAQGAVTEARARYEDLNALRNPPDEVRPDYIELRPIAAEFIGLAERVVTALVDGLELPTSTPGVQLQNLYDQLPDPEQLSACT